MSSNRLPSLDLLRGLAVLLMIIFHLIFDLNFFYGFKSLDYTQGFWFYEGRLAAILFILLSGLLTAVHFHKNQQKINWRKTIIRSLRLFTIALIITLTTWIIAPENIIIFGILHFLSVSIIIGSLLMPYPRLSLTLSPILIFAGWQLQNIRTTGNSLLIFGVPDYYFSSFDYYPLLPWLGVTLIGTSLGYYFYQNKKPLITIKQSNLTNSLGWIGQHSLGIYLIHQPILLILLKSLNSFF